MMQAGMDSAISKPFKMTALVDRIHEVIHGAKMKGMTEDLTLLVT